MGWGREIGEEVICVGAARGVYWSRAIPFGIFSIFPHPVIPHTIGPDIVAEIVSAVGRHRDRAYGGPGNRCKQGRCGLDNMAAIGHAENREAKRIG